jgi:hypothetical protein
VTRPRNRRHDHAVLDASHPRNARDDEHLGASEVEGPPTTLVTGVVTGTAFLAVRASPPVLDSRSQSNLDVLVDEIDTLHADALGVDAQGPG